jgi:hypothetical protein
MLPLQAFAFFLLGLLAANTEIPPDAVRTINIIANDILYDPVSRKIYASVPGSAGPGGNSIVPIDPQTGGVGDPILVGSEPGGMAISDDGRYLYVALNGAGEVRRVDLPEKKAGLQFPVGGVRGLAVVPGQRDRLVVSRGGGAGLGGGVAIFENGKMLPDSGVPNGFALSLGPRLYTYQNQITSWDFCTYTIGPTGRRGAAPPAACSAATSAFAATGTGASTPTMVRCSIRRRAGCWGIFPVPTSAICRFPIPPSGASSFCRATASSRRTIAPSSRSTRSGFPASPKAPAA